MPSGRDSSGDHAGVLLSHSFVVSISVQLPAHHQGWLGGGLGDFSAGVLKPGRGGEGGGWRGRDDLHENTPCELRSEARKSGLER